MKDLTNKEVRIPFYSGNIYDSICKGSVSLQAFIDMNKGSQSSEYNVIFDAVALAAHEGRMEDKRKLKHGLPAFTPTVFIAREEKRSYKNVKHFNRMVQLDFDGFDNQDEAKAFKHELFYSCVGVKKCKSIICAYISPSGLGVKALLRIPKARNIEHYRAIYKTVEKYFVSMVEVMESTCKFDSATKNAVLPLFLARDEYMLDMPFQLVDEWGYEDWTVEERENMIEEKPNQTSFSCSDRTNPLEAFNLKRTIRIFKDKISAINDEGHTQLRSACLTLGSRVGAQYITEAEAKDLAMTCVKSNSYFSKGVRGYIDTANWSIEEGVTRPRHYRQY